MIYGDGKDEIRTQVYNADSGEAAFTPTGELKRLEAKLVTFISFLPLIINYSESTIGRPNLLLSPEQDIEILKLYNISIYLTPNCCMWCK